MARSITEQTGWQRPYPNMLCNSFDTKAEVHEYNYDLSNADFKAYCKARGVLHLAGAGKRFDFTADHTASKSDFFTLFRLAIPAPDGSRHRFSDRDMETHWRIMLAAKGAFQDAWELFTIRGLAKATTTHKTPTLNPPIVGEMRDLFSVPATTGVQS